MTKAVRIENADNSNFRVVVIVQDKEFKQDEAGKWYDTGEWKEVERHELDYPTAMTNGVYLTTSRRIIVEEAPPKSA